MNLQTLTKDELLIEFYSANDYYCDLIHEHNIFKLIDTPSYIQAKIRLNAVLDEMRRRKAAGPLFRS